MRHAMLWAGIALWFGSTAGVANAQSMSDPSQRAHRGFFDLGARWQLQNTTEFDGGTKVHSNDDFGWQFGFGYNFSEKVAGSLEFGWNSVSYTVSAANLGLEPSGWYDTGGPMFSLTYNVLPKRLTPYATGGVGWAWVDSNIPVDEVNIGCWWDPWWGYICTPYQSTLGSSGFSYQVGGGLHMDILSSGFLQLGYQARWVDLDHGSPLAQGIRLIFGGTM